MNDIISTKLVEGIMHSVNCHSLLKDAQSGKYIDANQVHLNVYGFSTMHDLIGLTVWDLDSQMSEMWLGNAKQITAFEEEVLYTGKAVIQPKRVWLNASGFVWQHHMSKIPIFNRDNKVSAILSLGDDLTTNLSFFELYGYYCHFYKKKQLKVEKFLLHIGVYSYFMSLPTHAEVLVLIAKKTYVHNKLIAQHLNVSLGTVESHINKLCQKVSNLLVVLAEMSNK
ncbi:MAG: hypothetical protein KBD32_03275 [Burkholderiales bacterium]|nr:hypothetical protein [Burkholderiales bacterium]